MIIYLFNMIFFINYVILILCVRTNSHSLQYQKGHYVVLERNFKLRISKFTILNEVVSKLRTIYCDVNKQAVLREKHKVTEHCLKIEMRRGPPHVNKLKQSKSCTVGLFIQFIQS